MIADMNETDGRGDSEEHVEVEIEADTNDQAEGTGGASGKVVFAELINC